jgi:hypothetical protein
MSTPRSTHVAQRRHVHHRQFRIPFWQWAAVWCLVIGYWIGVIYLWFVYGH